MIEERADDGAAHIKDRTDGLGAHSVIEAARQWCAGSSPSSSTSSGTAQSTPGKVFDLTLPLDDVAEGCRAMDERRTIETLLRL